MELINPLVRRVREDATNDPEAYWDAAARKLPWLRTWAQVFEWTYPTFRWFSGAQTNLSYSALDHHVASGRGGHTALIALNERGEQRLLTYAQLKREVERIAAALRGMGIGQGDRITIYMPTGAEAIALMLATVRVGAIHSVVFAGFGAGALAQRIAASGSRLVFTADVTYRKGGELALKPIVDAAVAQCACVERVVVLRRGAGDVTMHGQRDITWEEFIARGAGQSGSYVALEANEPAFILATSGTTAAPKLAVHVHGGYQVHIHTMGQLCFGMTPDDVWWASSDIGWIVGHSYMVYAPLLRGCTTIAYEGAIDHPRPDRIWAILEEFGVTGLFTSPTAVRMLMGYGERQAHAHDLSALQRVFCAGEVLNAPAWEWLQKKVLRNRVPVIDNMWQTETGGPVFGNPYGIAILPTKPGSPSLPLPGIEIAIKTLDGADVPTGEKGIMTITRPFPGLIPTLWDDPERYQRDYWERISGTYATGDAAHVDEDGYVWFAGRADEVIKIAAHRLGTIEVETALMTHAAVQEAGVTGRPDELRGEVIAAFVVLKREHRASPELHRELLQTVRRELGALAVIGELRFVALLPKTRSGKIMRRVLKAVVLDRDPGDITTIEDELSVEQARAAWQQMKSALTSGQINASLAKNQTLATEDTENTE